MLIDTSGFSPSSIITPDYYYASSCSFLKDPEQEDEEDPNARQRELESAFCRDFLCCGQKLLDLHALLHHFEENHVFSEDEDEEDDEDNDPTIPFMLMEWTSAAMMFPHQNNNNNNNNNNINHTTSERMIMDNVFPQLQQSTPLQKQQQQQQQQQLPIMTTIDPMHATFQQEEEGDMILSSQIPTPFDSRGSSPIDTTSVSSSHSSSSGEDLCTPPPSPPLKKRKFPMEWYYPNNTTEIELLLQQVNSADLFYNYEEDASERPYKCQVDGCDKAYKNANGLKYHKAHGHCHEKQEDEDELNAKKPYRCSIGICNKRYKNLNGLKYHIEHTHLAKLRQRQQIIRNASVAAVHHF